MKKIGLIVFGLIWGCAWASAEVNGTCTIQKVVFSVGGKALLSGYILSGINGLTVTSEDYFLDAMELPGNETWGPVCTGTKEKLLFLSYVLGKKRIVLAFLLSSSTILLTGGRRRSGSIF